MLGWLLELFQPRCSHLVLVAAPEGEAAIRNAAEQLLAPDQFHVAVQPEPRGMADAVRVAMPWVRTANCIVVWGDQLSLRTNTVDLCMKAHSRTGALLTLPTVLKAAPYIHFERDECGRITRVLEARERAGELAFGENDCGVFFFDSLRLSEILATMDASAIGDRTGELNLLPLVPQFEAGPGTVLTLRVATEEETFGINTRQEADRMEALLLARREGRTWAE
jgi:bifunctional N-acetylglucosamine-1-phosphate-uridyltransferase/glucosamine-1-phosphate-acetyltransferase GlmU-like protein